VLSTISFIAVLSILVIIHELGHFLVAKRNGVKVEKFSIGFGPKVFGIKRKDTEYLISAIPLGGYVKMAGDSFEDSLTGQPWEFYSKSPGVRARIILAGPFLNYVLGFVLFSLIFMIGSPMLTSRVGELLEGYPAAEAGIKAGDAIVAIDGVRVEYWEDLTAIIRKKTTGRPVNLLVNRDGGELSVLVAPKIEEKKDIFGNTEKIALIGVKPSQEVINVKYNFIESIYLGAKKLFFLTYMTFKAIFYMLIGRMSVKDSVTGPVGIFVLTGKAAELGIVYLMQMMAVLSSSLAIFNVLPIPVLDGGHLFFIAIEKLRKKAVSPKTQEAATQVGLYLLIALMILVFYSDFVKFGVFEKISNVFK